MYKLLLSRSQFVYLLLLIESIFLYIFSPEVYIYEFDLFCMLQFVVASVGYIAVQKKKNYFDFDFIFLLTTYFTLFFFPVFVYNTDFEPFLFAYSYYYDETLISRGTALALMGCQAYMFGGLLVNRKRIESECVEKPKKIIPNGILAIGMIICFILFFLAAGGDLFSHTYDGTIGGEDASGTVTYILVLLGTMLTATIAIEFHNWSIGIKYSKKWIVFLVLSAFVAIFLLIGSRTYPLQFILLVIGLYSIKVKPINLKKMLLLILSGFVILGFVGLYRIADSSTADDLQEGMGVLVFVQDLLLNNRNTFVAMDIVRRDGINFGLGMVTPVFGVFPFANSIILNMTPLTELDLSSGLQITAYSLGKTSDFEVGFGTNIIADIYMSFGSVGVVIMMLLLGFFVKKSMYKAIYDKNIYHLLIYGVMVSYAVYIVRAEYFVFLRFMIWSLVFVNIAKLHPYRLNLKLKRLWYAKK